MVTLALLILAPVDLAVIKRRDPETAALAEMFVSACLDGSLRLSSSQGTEVLPRNVPFWVRERNEAIKSIHYYQLRKPAKAYLVTVNYQKPGPNGEVSDCYVAANRIWLQGAATAVHHALTQTTPRYEVGSRFYSLFLPEQNAHVSATRYYIDVTRYDPATSQKLYRKLNRQKKREPQFEMPGS